MYRSSNTKDNTKTMSELLCHILKGYDVNFTKIILHYIERVREASRKSALPYVNLLTKIFKHFNIPLDGKEFVGISKRCINQATVKSFNFKQLPSVQLMHKDEVLKSRSTSNVLKCHTLSSLK